jgi:Chalcone isomerase-like
MKRMGMVVAALLLLGAGTAAALEVQGVQIEPTVTVQGEALRLNGYGIREKFFFDIYLGSLYTAQPVASTEAALAAPGSKLIRMNFLYHKVDREKIVEAFAEGYEKNSPQLAGGAPAKAFLGWFVHDFVRGDVVDLELDADGTVAARQNGTLLGSLRSPELARGVLLIYLGDKPADAGLKQGMLGRS